MQRAEERAAILKEILKNQISKDPKAKKLKTRKDRKSKKGEGPTTYDITLEMFNKGMTIEQIAKERELVTSTIEGHLGKAVEAARLDISALVNESELNEITGVIEHLPSGFISKDLYDGLRGKYGYGKLRAVMNHLKAQSIEEKNVEELPDGI